jgi:hypothetical protein
MIPDRETYSATPGVSLVWCPYSRGKLVADLIAAAADPNAPRSEDLPQSELRHRFDLVDGPAVYAMTNVLYNGAKKYGEDNWRTIPVEDHLNHLIAHAYAYLSGDRSTEHLANIMCRSMFAQGRAIMDENASGEVT